MDQPQQKPRGLELSLCFSYCFDSLPDHRKKKTSDGQRVITVGPQGQFVNAHPIETW